MTKNIGSADAYIRALYELNFRLKQSFDQEGLNHLLPDAVEFLQRPNNLRSPQTLLWRIAEALRANPPILAGEPYLLPLTHGIMGHLIVAEQWIPTPLLLRKPLPGSASPDDFGDIVQEIVSFREAAAQKPPSRDSEPER